MEDYLYALDEYLWRCLEVSPNMEGIGSQFGADPKSIKCSYICWQEEDWEQS